MVWRYPEHISIPFTSLPPASSNNGRTMKCDPLVAGQGYTYWTSDGTYWRPAYGRQTLYALPSDILGTTTANPELFLTIPFPALLMPDGRTQLRTSLGADHLIGTSDTVNFYQRFGTAGTVADAVLAQCQAATTQLAGGWENDFSRVSPTELRKHGAGAVTVPNPMSGVTTVARAAAITVGNLGTTLNYLTVWCDLTTGGTEKGNLHAFTVEIVG